MDSHEDMAGSGWETVEVDQHVDYPPWVEDPEEEEDSRIVSRLEEVDDSDSDDGFGKLPPSFKVGVDYDAKFRRQEDAKRQKVNLDGEMQQSVNDDWLRLVESSRFTDSQSSLKLPWERGFAASVFANPGAFLMCVLPVPRELPFVTTIGPKLSSALEAETALEHVSTIPGAWKAVAQRISELKFHISKDEARQAALAKWKYLLLLDPSKSELGRKLIGQLLKFQNDQFLNQVILDVFSHKATATLSKRANHLLEFAAWCNRNKLQFLPLNEAEFYRFLIEVRTKISATSAKSSKESVAFSISTLGFDGAQAIADSSLIKGLCHRMELCKKPTKQAVVLTRKQVLCLERTLYNPECWLPDRVFAGHCLWALYGRLRWEDSLWSTGISIDENTEGSGYCESLSLGTTKTATSAKQKTTFLPHVSPINGLEAFNWPAKWISLRRIALLPFAGERDEKGKLFPLITEVNSAGKFTTVPLGASRASVWLKEILDTSPDSPGDTVTGNSSHALKSTTLSWVSKHGSCDPYTRKMLGYHADSSENSMHTYSRDCLAKPLRDYEKVILAVADGSFDPDSTRSGYFPRIPKNPKVDLSRSDSERAVLNLPSTAVLPVTEIVQELDPTISSKERSLSTSPKQSKPKEVVDSSSSDDSPDSSASEDPFVSNLPDSSSNLPNGKSSSSGSRGPASALGDVRVCHIRLKTLHSVHKDDPSKLACGRKFHEGFKIVDELSLAMFLCDYPQCSGCFGSAKPK